MDMKPLFRRQETGTKKPGGFFAVLHWLLSLIQLTEEEKDAAGIYFGSLYDNDGKS